LCRGLEEERKKNSKKPPGFGAIGWKIESSFREEA